MKAVVVLCLFLALSFASYEAQFRSFMTKYHKSYKSQEEYQLRFQIFQDNMKRAAELQRREKPNGARFGVTKFSDLSPEEFAARMLHFNTNEVAQVEYEMPMDSNAVRSPNAATTWNWYKRIISLSTIEFIIEL